MWAASSCVLTLIHSRKTGNELQTVCTHTIQAINSILYAHTGRLWTLQCMCLHTTCNELYIVCACIRQAKDSKLYVLTQDRQWTLHCTCSHNTGFEHYTIFAHTKHAMNSTMYLHTHDMQWTLHVCVHTRQAMDSTLYMSIQDRLWTLHCMCSHQTGHGLYIWCALTRQAMTSTFDVLT